MRLNYIENRHFGKVFTKSNFLALDQVRKQQVEVQQILQELDKRHKELDIIVERAKNASIDPNQENENEDDSEISTYCVTCGHEIHSRTAIKHMEKCFNKYESQASFGSIFKTRIEGKLQKSNVMVAISPEYFFNNFGGSKITFNILQT